MISNERPKSNKKLIFISVLVLTILTINVSYSAFFDVKTQDNIHSFTSGTLNVVIDNANSTALSGSLMPTSTGLPTAASSAAPSSGYATVTLSNSGSLNADFVISLVSDSSVPAAESVDYQYLNIGIYDVAASSWVALGSNKYYTLISNLTASSTGVYPVMRSKINNQTTKTYRIYIWLSSGTKLDQIGKKVNLKISVKSTTEQGQQNNNGLPSVTIK